MTVVFLIWQGQWGSWTRKSCFCDRALVEATFEASKCLCRNTVLEASNWFRLKPMFLKHYFRRQDLLVFTVPVGFHIVEQILETDTLFSEPEFKNYQYSL